MLSLLLTMPWLTVLLNSCASYFTRYGLRNVLLFFLMRLSAGAAIFLSVHDTGHIATIRRPLKDELHRHWATMNGDPHPPEFWTEIITRHCQVFTFTTLSSWFLLSPVSSRCSCSPKPSLRVCPTILLLSVILE